VRTFLILGPLFTGAAIAIGAIGLIFFSTHGDEPGSSAAFNIPAPRFSLDGTSFDLGEVPADTIVERTVEFQNSGQEPLTVSVVKVRPAPDAACGCGVEGFQVRPATVAPGGAGQIVFHGCGIADERSGEAELQDRHHLQDGHSNEGNEP